MGDREYRKETDFWGNEKEVIYRDGERIGEIRTEERGGIFGFGSDSVKVEIDNDGNDVSYVKQEDRGGFLGLGAETQEVRYDAEHNEIGHSRIEERGGLLGLGVQQRRVEYDNEGNELSEFRYERRGGILGIGSERVKIAHRSEFVVSSPSLSEADRNANHPRSTPSFRTQGKHAEPSAEGGAFAQVILTLGLIYVGINTFMFISENADLKSVDVKDARLAAASHSTSFSQSFDFSSYSAETRPLIEIGPREWGSDFAVSPEGVAHFSGRPLFESKEIEGHGDGMLLRVFLSPDRTKALAFYWQIYFDEGGVRRGHRFIDAALVGYEPTKILNSKLLHATQTVRSSLDEQTVYWSLDRSTAAFKLGIDESDRVHQILVIDLKSGVAQQADDPHALR